MVVNYGSSASAASAPGPSWLNGARARANQLSSGALSGAAEWWDDFLDQSRVVQTNVTGGSTVLSKSLGAGVATIATGTGGASSSAIITPVGIPAFVSNAQTKQLYGYWRCRFDGPITANNASLRVGFVNPNNISSGGAYFWFGHSGAGALLGSATKFIVQYVQDGGVGLVSTPTTADLELSLFHDVEFYSDGTTGTFYLDGAPINVTVPMSGVGAVPLTIFMRAFTLDGTSRVLNVDRAYASFLA